MILVQNIGKMVKYWWFMTEIFTVNAVVTHRKLFVARPKFVRSCSPLCFVLVLIVS